MDMSETSFFAALALSAKVNEDREHNYWKSLMLKQCN